MAILFDADSERVEVPAHSSIDDLSSMTLMLWYYAVDVSSVGVSVTKHSDAGGDGFSLFRPQFAVGPNDWWFIRNRTTTDTQVQTSGNYIQTNRWEWACVMDSDGVAPDMLVGPLFGATVTPTYGTRTTGSGGTAGDSDRDLWIGDSPDFSQPAQQRIALVQMFNRRLSIAEAASYKLRPRPGNGCVLFLQLGLYGATAVDLSGYGNHGTVFNGTLAPHMPLDLRSYRPQMFFPVAATMVNIADAGSGADALGSLAASLGIADSGAGADSGSFAAALALVDTGSGLDALLAAVYAAIADAGSGADALPGIAAALTLADTGSGAEAHAITVSLTIADTGGGGDALNVLTEILIQIAESGAGSDVLGITVSTAVADTGSGVDAPATRVGLQVADSGSGLDALNVIMAILVSVADSGAGADAIGPITVSLGVADSGSVVDAIAGIAAVLAVLESATGVDAVVQFDTASKIVTITFSLAQRQVIFSLSQRSMIFGLSQRSITFDLN